MPLYDYRCANGHVTEERRSFDEREIKCSECGAHSIRVFLTTPSLDYGRMAMGDGCASAIDRFDRMHREQRKKEEKSLREHGDYGPRPGSD